MQRTKLKRSAEGSRVGVSLVHIYSIVWTRLPNKTRSLPYIISMTMGIALILALPWNLFLMIFLLKCDKINKIKIFG